MQTISKTQPSLIRSASLPAGMPACSSVLPVARHGVNLAGAEFGSAMPGEYGVTYIYPTTEVVNYHRSQQRTLVRLPFRWERIQRSLYAPLDEDELERLKQFLSAAHAAGMHAILDVHNYGRYVFTGDDKCHGDIIGSKRVPYGAFADLWSRLADALHLQPAVYAYGLMNEPHDMDGYHRWPAAAQAAIDAIREIDRNTIIMAPGDDWTSARTWRDGVNNSLHEQLHDPQDKLVFEAHCYFDQDNSGTYVHSYDGEGASPFCGVEYVLPFVEWCEEKGVRGFIGEYGIPDTDTRWLVVMDRFLNYLSAHNMSSAYWAGGPWWQENSMAIEPQPLAEAGSEPVHRPQMLVLRQYAG